MTKKTSQPLHFKDQDQKARFAAAAIEAGFGSGKGPGIGPWLRSLGEAEIACLPKEADGSFCYRGNSVAHWHAKAAAYGAIVFGCTPALESAGFPVCGDAVPNIAVAVEKMAARIAELEALPPANIATAGTYVGADGKVIEYPVSEPPAITFESMTAGEQAEYLWKVYADADVGSKIERAAIEEWDRLKRAGAKNIVVTGSPGYQARYDAALAYVKGVVGNG